MILLQAHNLTKSYAGTDILTQINVEVKSHDRIGLVGANGAGKSTLMNILTGKLPYDEGEIFKSKQTTMGYLAQDSGLESEASIWEEMKKIFTPLIEQEQQIRAMETAMSDPEMIKNEQQYETLLADYAISSDSFKEKGGYEYEARIRNVLHGLNFQDKNYNDQIYTLSGGQKTRLALGKLLLSQPDLLMLDEPTNYLDLPTLAWLEQYLLSYSGAILIVSHDRYFLDKLCNVIYEIERTKATKYTGNYTQFLAQKADIYALQMKQYQKQEKVAQEMEDFVQRNIARASTSKRAKSRQKMLDKMDRQEAPDGDLKKAAFSFDIERPSGQDVLQVENMSIGYANKQPLAKNISFHVYKGDRIAIVGPNGIGKTTLLKTIIGHQPALFGNVRKGANLSMSFYDQEQDDLQAKNTILSEIWDQYPHMLEKDVRGLLGQFLFSGDDVKKKIAELSGGERARVAIAKLMLEKGNLLILDEPTNHLDIYSKEMLEEALLDYPGTILFVSHDRYFLNQISTKVVELQPDGSDVYLGDYDYFVEKKEELKAIQALTEKKATSEKKDDSIKQEFQQKKEEQRERRKLLRRKDELEEHIEKLEIEMDNLEAKLLQPEVNQDYQKAQEVQDVLLETQNALDQLLEEWSTLAEKTE